MRRVIAIFALAALPLCAQAESLSHTWTPRTEAQAHAIRGALALHSLRSRLREGGTIRQWGRENRAALSQSGSGNWGAILQRGDDHDARLKQKGDGNAHAILQAGRETEAEVEQDGDEVGVTLQYGW
ncbi:curlin [Rubellimicrobium rubrum]|uniref:Curlin n=1 Tax=Rubellimicrobium rubrum TaxID=2585369 RepID=A0A5C4N6W0_9RHOB|nr:curlin [Rubellimicrobium rubrum]TNC52031.1 curlin [Rubellimicrobium rubrum]